MQLKPHLTTIQYSKMVFVAIPRLVLAQGQHATEAPTPTHYHSKGRWSNLDGLMAPLQGPL